jgi:ribose-phosphate pyrophosphokinase
MFIAGSAGSHIAKPLSQCFKQELFSCETTCFNNGELKVQIPESVFGKTVILVQSTAYPPNDTLMELLLAAAALQSQGAQKLILLVPYLGYGRQDRIEMPGSSLSAAVIAKILNTVKPDLMLTLEIHSPQNIGFFDFPVLNVNSGLLIAQDIQTRFKDHNICLVSPDLGAINRVRSLAKFLQVPMAVVDKERFSSGKLTTHNLIGDVAGKTCVLIDDMIDTGNTLKAAIDFLEREKAQEIHAYAVHALCKEGDIKSLFSSSLTSLSVTDSISHPTSSVPIRVLPCAPLFESYLAKIMAPQ